MARYSVDSTVVSIFVDVFVELKNTTIKSTNIEMAVLSKVEPI